MYLTMKKSLFFVCSLFLLSSPVAFAQDEPTKKADAYEADKKFLQGNYEAALDDYLALLDKDPKNDKYNYDIAICYLNTNINKSKAIPYLEIPTQKTKYDTNAMYMMGSESHSAYRFEDAIKAYNAFKQTGRGNAGWPGRRTGRGCSPPGWRPSCRHPAPCGNSPPPRRGNPAPDTPPPRLSGRCRISPPVPPSWLPAASDRRSRPAGARTAPCAARGTISIRD